MTALKSADIDRFIAKPDPRQPVILVYGPDAGLVRERVDALVRASVDDPNDPFALARIEGDEIAANPARLVEEAQTVPLFGGRRAVLVRVGPRHNIAPAVEILIEQPAPDCRVVIEAGDLRKTAPLRKLCESAKTAAVLPCYADNERDLGRLIDEEMRAAGLTLAPDARAALIALLGGDRLASRSEVRKLALYAMGKERVELDDVRAVVTDASEQALDGVLDAAFAGKPTDVEAEFGKARASVGSAGAIVSAAIRHVANLHKIRLAIEDGEDARTAMRRGAPPIHFSREAMVEAALRAWTSSRLLRAMQQLADALFETRRQADLADVISHRTLLALAMNARRKD
ncbi:MAG TPA: DNA polymerase III subunit delta [Pseudolabrys sp.]|nr:DNA polymerase III subunit delta [Pseudolabrys sp.]